MGILDDILNNVKLEGEEEKEKKSESVPPVKLEEEKKNEPVPPIELEDKKEEEKKSETISSVVNVSNKKNLYSNLDDLEEGIGSFNVKIIGVGGAGCNVINHMLATREWGEKVDIFALNTDYNSLLKLKGKTNTILLGKTLLRGAGSGGDPLIGECAVKENIDTLKEILSGTDVLFIIAGLGKGTGSGASPEIAKVAKELNILVISIVNLPSIIAEGTEVYTNALGSFESLKANSDSITTISNDKIIKACGNIISFKEAFKEADEEVTSIVYEIVEGITVPSDVNVDLNDVKNFFKGNAVFLSRIISSEGDYDSESLYQLIQNALEKSYSNVSVSSQNISIIANLKISNKIPPSIVADISNIFKQISKGANIKIVNGINYSTDEKLRISLLISGNSDGTQSSSDTSHYENKPNNDYISFGNSGNNTSKLNPYKLFADTPTEKTRGLKVKKATLDKSRLIDDTFIDDETKEKDKYSEAMTKAVEGILGSSNEEDPKNN